MLKKILLAVVLALVVIQLIRPAINGTQQSEPADLFALHPAPASVRQTVQNACYDCHSSATRLPWYAQVQPVRWWLASHVRDGRRHLDFSHFGDYPAKRAARKLQDCVDEMQDGSMPLPSYTWIHRDARLSPEQKNEVTGWFAALREQIKAANPGAVTEPGRTKS